MNNNIEVYANITGFSKYQVSNFGNCKNIKTGRILKPAPDGGGYLQVILVDDGETSAKKIHKLVASAFLENPEDKKCVDHVDHDRKNNYLSNLRFATHAENNQNKSMQSNNTTGIVGVCWDKKQNKWKVQITVNGVKKYLGRFTSKEDAITTRHNAEIQYFGEFRAIIPEV
jgi:HNH endonuclease/NUMOD4 motif/AP2 domain